MIYKLLENISEANMRLIWIAILILIVCNTI